MKVCAIVPAAGCGTRMKARIAKPYLTLGDRPLLAYTLQALQACPLINKIYVVVAEPMLNYFKQEIMAKYPFGKVAKIVIGGKQRQDSVYNGLRQIDPTCQIVVVHDGVRPLVSPQLIEQVIQVACADGAAIAALPSTDTLKQVSPDGFIEQTVPRHNLWAAQTPQAFSYELLKKAYEKAWQDGFYGTDEASLVERLGYKIRVIVGSPQNIKITTSEDLALAEVIVKSKKTFLPLTKP